MPVWWHGIVCISNIERKWCGMIIVKNSSGSTQFNIFLQVWKYMKDENPEHWTIVLSDRHSRCLSLNLLQPLLLLAKTKSWVLGGWFTSNESVWKLMNQLLAMELPPSAITLTSPSIQIPQTPHCKPKCIL